MPGTSRRSSISASSRRLVLALRRRGLAVPVHLHLCLGPRRGGRWPRRALIRGLTCYKGRPQAAPFSFCEANAHDQMIRDAATVTQSALRGIACRCPRCGKGKLYAGFLDLRPSCEACGLDYAFIDAGDGPAIFIIMIAGAIVVGCGPDRRSQVPAAVLAACGAVAAADPRDHAAAAALDEVAVDRAAVPSQGGARPADRPRAEMTGSLSRRRGGRRLRHLHAG